MHDAPFVATLGDCRPQNVERLRYMQDGKTGYPHEQKDGLKVQTRIFDAVPHLWETEARLLPALNACRPQNVQPNLIGHNDAYID